jgi:hypothetical protein
MEDNYSRFCNTVEYKDLVDKIIEYNQQNGIKTSEENTTEIKVTEEITNIKIKTEEKEIKEKFASLKNILKDFKIKPKGRKSISKNPNEKTLEDEKKEKMIGKRFSFFQKKEVLKKD